MEKDRENINLQIKSWAEEDRPREKLVLKGKASLSDAELLAIIIGTGTKRLSAVDVAKLVLQKAGNNLNEMAKFSIKDLTKIKGIGEAKAITIAAAIELGRRRKEESLEVKPVIQSSAQIYQEMIPVLTDLPHEEAWVLLLDRSSRVIKKIQISSGGVSGTVIDVRIIYKHAIEHLASCLALIHNHPSGQLRASSEDLKITQQVKQAGLLLNIPLIDHLIFTNTAYYSLADEGLL